MIYSVSSSYSFSSTLSIAITAGGAALIVGLLVSHVSSQRKRLAFESTHGCQPLSYYKGKAPFFSLDFMLENIKAVSENRLLESLAARWQKWGPTYGLHIGSWQAILTVDPANIKTILATKFKDYSIGNRADLMGPLLGLGIFTADGEDWQHSRAMLRPNFVKDQVADLRSFEGHIQDLLKLIPRDGKSVELQQIFHRFTLDSATEFLFGHSTHTLRDPGKADEMFSTAFNYSLAEMAYLFHLGPLAGFRYNRKARKMYNVCRTYANKFVDDAMEYRKEATLEDGSIAEKGTGSKNKFLQELAKGTDDKNRIRDEVLNILIAGRDTTASALSNMFFELSRRPQIWEKLRQEVSQLDGKPPSYEELKNLKFAKYCVQETLRLYPSVPLNNRLAIRDTVLPVGGGPKGDKPIFVPKGCLIMYSVYAMHRRKDFFGEDADDFRPKRWERSQHSWEYLGQYLPFNGGPRICLGQQYALTETAYVLVRLVQEFARVESCDPLPWSELLSLTLSSGNGVHVRLTPA